MQFSREREGGGMGRIRREKMWWNIWLGFCGLVALTSVSTIAYVIAHFIAKFW